MQLLTGLQFDICYAIKTRVGFEIAEMTRFWKYIGSYSFAPKKCSFENFGKFSGVRVQWRYLFIKLLNAKLLMSNFSAEIFIFKYF